MRPSSADDVRYDRRELVAPPDVDARMRQSWQRLAQQMETKRPTARSRVRPMLAWGGGVAFAAACVVMILPALDESVRSSTPTASIHSAAARTVAVLPAATEEGVAQQDPVSVPSLPVEEEPVEVSMEPHAEVAVISKSATHTRYRLARGQATFEAPEHANRSLVVEVGGVELRMVSSRVTVLSNGKTRPLIEVFVEKGSVTVQGRDKPLTQGERLVLDTESSTQRARRHRSLRTRAEAVPALEAGDTRSLLDIAGSERRAGRFQEAARHYEQMMREQPDDPRVPLAAFELGRLRMDQLNDLRGAIAPLKRAVASGGTSASQEDALARLVRVYDRLNDQNACLTERARYLKRFAQGIHHVEMEQRCKGTP